jgi:hypothetical protein
LALELRTGLVSNLFDLSSFTRGDGGDDLVDFFGGDVDLDDDEAELISTSSDWE